MADMRVLLSEEQIKERVKELGNEISRDFAGEELLVVGVLKGAFVFLADLIRHIDLPLQVDFIDLSSYGLTTESSGEVRIIDLEQPIEEEHLIVEDIVVTGYTLKYIKEIMLRRNPRSLRICTFGQARPSQRCRRLDYNGFTIPDTSS